MLQPESVLFISQILEYCNNKYALTSLPDKTPTNSRGAQHGSDRIFGQTHGFKPVSVEKAMRRQSALLQTNLLQGWRCFNCQAIDLWDKQARSAWRLGCKALANSVYFLDNGSNEFRLQRVQIQQFRNKWHFTVHELAELTHASRSSVSAWLADGAETPDSVAQHLSLLDFVIAQLEAHPEIGVILNRSAERRARAAMRKTLKAGQDQALALKFIKAAAGEGAIDAIDLARLSDAIGISCDNLSQILQKKREAKNKNGNRSQSKTNCH